MAALQLGHACLGINNKKTLGWVQTRRCPAFAPFAVSHPRLIKSRRGLRAAEGFGNSAPKEITIQGDADPADASTREDLGAQVSSGLGGTNVYLVGMMGRVPLIKTGRFAVQHKLVEEMLCGSGKSVVGKALAQRLRYAFFDSDDVLESASGASVNEVINQVGIDEFRDLETQVIKELYCYKNCVISTGGGAVIKTTNWSYLRQGIVVWLNGSPPLLASRIFMDGVGTRPLLSSCSSEEEVSTKLAAILSESGDAALSVDAVVQQILELLSSRMREAILERESKRNFEIEYTDPDANPVDSASTPFWKRIAEMNEGKGANDVLDSEE